MTDFDPNARVVVPVGIIADDMGPRVQNFYLSGRLVNIRESAGGLDFAWTRILNKMASSYLIPPEEVYEGKRVDGTGAFIKWQPSSTGIRVTCEKMAIMVEPSDSGLSFFDVT